METNKPVLSICIPTYNRAEYLDKSLNSIVSQKEFNSEDVELVISDNSSTDNTEEVVNKYKNRYKNIIYSRNGENIRDKNFPHVIGIAHGVYRKLFNDTILHNKDSVKAMLDTVNENIDKKPVLFFLNRSIGKLHKKKYIVNDFNSFVKTISFWITWIGGFGIWDDDYNKIEDKYAGCETHLWQTKVLLEIIVNKEKGFIDNRQLFSIQDIKKKDISYGLYNIFYINYFNIFQYYLNKNILSINTYNYLRKHILFDFFLSCIINYKFDYCKFEILPDDNIEQLILNEYRRDSYYSCFCLWLKYKILEKKIRRFFKEKLYGLSRLFIRD